MFTALVTLVATAAPTSVAQADVHKVTVQGQGFDACQDPTLSQMTTWWNGTPFYVVEAYIGGADMGCPQPNLSASWVASVTSMGWTVLPIWVGPQSPCYNTSKARISTNTTTAYDQGENEARSAYQQMVTTLGMSPSSAIVYDMEAATSTPTCDAAEQAFMRGWTGWLHAGTGQTAGIYTSTCGGKLSMYASVSPTVDFVWGGDADNAPNTSFSCVPSGYWTNHQRHKQFTAGHWVNYNGLIINVDLDCSDGPADGTKDSGYINCVYK